MLKKVLMVLGAVFLVLVALFVVMLVWAGKKSAELQQKFFAAVESGDPEQVLVLLKPEVRTGIDPPVLPAWMKAMKSDLGAYKGLSGFKTSSNFTNGATRTESAATVDFEKGTAQSDLIFLDGQIAGFHVRSPQIPDDWFQGPDSTELYRSRGREFLQDLFHGDTDAAFALMDSKLQKKIPRDELKSKLAEAKARTGPLKSVDYESETIDAGSGHALTVLYRIEGESAKSPAKITFEFVGFKGAMADFDLAASAK
jgi:hypothetical protein